MDPTMKKNPAQDAVNALQRGDSILLGGSPKPDSPVKRTHHRDPISSYVRDFRDPDQIRVREDLGDEYVKSIQDLYQSSIEEDWRGDLNEPEDLEEDDGRWSEPKLFWDEFRPVEKRACHLLFKIHQNGLNMDEVSPMTTEQATKFRPRLLDLYDRVSHVGDPSLREDAIHALTIFRDSHPILRDSVIARQKANKAARDKERNEKAENRKLKKEYDRGRNADPGRKSREAARQRARRAALKEMR